MQEKHDRELASHSPSSPQASLPSTNPFASAIASSSQSGGVPKQPSIDLFGLSSPTSDAAPVAASANVGPGAKSADDLFGFGATSNTFEADFSSAESNPFGAPQQPAAASQAAFNPWGAPAASKWM